MNVFIFQNHKNRHQPKPSKKLTRHTSKSLDDIPQKVDTIYRKRLTVRCTQVSQVIKVHLLKPVYQNRTNRPTDQPIEKRKSNRLTGRWTDQQTNRQTSRPTDLLGNYYRSGKSTDCSVRELYPLFQRSSADGSRSKIFWCFLVWFLWLVLNTLFWQIYVYCLL